jgi:hypothetical protein
MAKKNGGGFGKVFLGFVLGVAATAAGLYLYLKFGPLPVAVADAPFPFERQVVRLPLHARIEREQKQAPFGIGEDVLRAGRRFTGRSARGVTALRGMTSDSLKRCIPGLLSCGRNMGRTESSG